MYRNPSVNSPLKPSNTNMSQYDSPSKPNKVTFREELADTYGSPSSPSKPATRESPKDQAKLKTYESPSKVNKSSEKKCKHSNPFGKSIEIIKGKSIKSKSVLTLYMQTSCTGLPMKSRPKTSKTPFSLTLTT